MEKTRRRFLLSTAAASTAALAGCSGNNNDDDPEEPTGPTNEDPPEPDNDRHETNIPDSDQYRIRKAYGQTVHLQPGETYENVIWDLTTGRDVTINTIGVEDWEIRNVGFYGQYQGGSSALMTLGAMEGDTGRVENVYIGDGGSEEGSEHRPTAPSAIVVDPNHEGHIEFVDCNVQGFPEAGIYSLSESGTCSWNRCYIGNHGIVALRSNTDSEIRNSVLFNDGTEYGEDNVTYDGTLVSAYAPGGLDIYDTHLSAGTNEALSSAADAEDTVMHSGELDGAIYGPFEVADAVGENPTVERPEGVPTSATNAASAGQSESGTDGNGDTDPEEESDGQS